MVTIHRAYGFRFVIFMNGHSPPHIHVFGQGGEAKIELMDDGGVKPDWTSGISRADLRRLLVEARDNHEIFLAAWSRING